MSTSKNLFLDLTMFGAFLAVTNPHLTGNTIHEWLGVSLAGAVITHLLSHWDWIIKVGKQFFQKLWHQSRLNYVVNVLFFTAMTGSFFSGLMISKDVMSTLGIHLNVNGSWKMLHTLMSDVSVVALGVHVALHWKWIVNSLGRYIVTPIGRTFQRRAVRQPMVPQTVRMDETH